MSRPILERLSAALFAAALLAGTARADITFAAPPAGRDEVVWEDSGSEWKEAPIQIAKKKDDAAEAEGGDADFSEFEDEIKGDAGPVHDPLGGYNRFMFGFNDIFYTFLFKPAAQGYNFLFPGWFRESVDRAFVNMAFPVRFLSSSFQGDFGKATRSFNRFLLNSTVGLGGLFDPAYHWGHLEPVDEDFGQMMGRWGMGDGFPIVLPILGQSNLRDAFGRAPNSFLSPVYYVADPLDYLAVSAGGQFNYLSLHYEEYDKIKKDALDPYTHIRDIYKQNRDKKIKE